MTPSPNCRCRTCTRRRWRSFYWWSFTWVSLTAAVFYWSYHA